MEPNDLEIRKPKLVYKYHQINQNLLDLISEGQLWFSHQNELNDPFDCKYALTDKFLFSILEKSSSELLEDLKRNLPQIKNVSNDKFYQYIKPWLQTNEWMSGFYNMLFGEYLGWSVCCFTTNPLNELMWAHYAKNSKGVCLEFDLSNSPELSDKLHPVKYTNKLPEVNSMDELPEALLTKRLAWAIEEEWRILSNVHGIKQFNKDSLTSIYFGYNVSAKTIEDIKKVLIGSGYKKVDFKKVSFRINGYALNNIEDDTSFKQMLERD